LRVYEKKLNFSSCFDQFTIILGELANCILRKLQHTISLDYAFTI
jgi:hypothetical protein